MITCELHKAKSLNVGDRWCNPSRYFKFDNLYSDELTYCNAPVEDNILVIGGGGLIHKKFSQQIINHLGRSPRLSILWGAGHNFNKKHINKTNPEIYYPDWLTKMSLVGIRDWIDGHYDSYLPCASCMHPAFDKNYSTKHDIVYFVHEKKTKFTPQIDDICMANNNVNINEVVEFLGSARTVVTDSYHGAYWSQLLGKDVRVVPWSTKFLHMKYPPAQIDSIKNWQKSESTQIPENFLQECRELNQKFYRRFLDLTENC